MTQKTSGVHYAWIICLGGMLMFFASAGMAVNAFFVYQPFIAEAYGYSQSQLSLINTAKCIGQMAATLILGLYYRKFSTRKGIVLGLLLSILGYIFFGIGTWFPMFLVGGFLSGASSVLAGMLAISLLTEKWFISRFGLATSTSSAGSGLAVACMPSIITFLVQKYDLRTAFLVEAGLIAIISILCFLLIRSCPEEMGLSPYQEGTKHEDEKPAIQRRTAPCSIKNMLPVYLIMVFCGCLGGPGWGNVSLLASLMGYNAQVIAASASILGFSLLIGKVLFGMISDHSSLYRASLLFCAITTVGAILFCLSGSSRWILYLGSVLYGGALGVTSIGIVSWVQDWFPESEWIREKQRFLLAYNTGGILFSPLPGILADHLPGGYIPTYLLLTIFGIYIFVTLIYAYKQCNETPGKESNR